MEQAALRAESIRSDLTDLFGIPYKGLPLGVDLLQALMYTATGKDGVDDPSMVRDMLNICACTSAYLDDADVWAAPASLSRAIAEHPLLKDNDGYVFEDADEATSPAGVVFFPEPISTVGVLPIHGLTWQVTNKVDQALTLAVSAIVATEDVRSRVPASVAPGNMPRTPYTLNSYVVTGRSLSHTMTDFGMPLLWGAPTARTLVALVLAFWDLRPGTEHDVKTIRGTTRRRGKGSRPKSRKVRIIRESASRYTGERTPAEHEHRWNEDTLRWEVAARTTWRCPNPHQHRQIIESGGSCPKVKVLVKSHINGPKGRAVDPRRTARIARANTDPT